MLQVKVEIRMAFAATIKSNCVTVKIWRDALDQSMGESVCVEPYTKIVKQKMIFIFVTFVKVVDKSFRK